MNDVRIYIIRYLRKYKDYKVDIDHFFIAVNLPILLYPMCK